MSLEEQLKAEILTQHRSVRAFAMAANIPYTTLDSVLKRGVEKAGVVTVLRIFSALDLDVESIATGVLRKKESNPASGEDARLLDMFHQFNNEGQEKLLETADDMIQSGKYIKTCPMGLDREA